MNVSGAGKLRDRITFQQPATTQDSFGQPDIAWSDVCTVWANHSDLSGQKLVAAQAINAETQSQFVIRYRTGLTKAMRIVHDGRYYNVHAILDQEGRKRWLHVNTSEGMNLG